MAAKYDGSPNCTALGALSQQYINAGGGSPGTALEVEINLERARVHAWMARALSESLLLSAMFVIRTSVVTPRSTIRRMQVTTGTVVDGQIVVEGDPLPDGTVVTILARESRETFVVPPELEAELLESLAEAQRGELNPAEELFQRLRRDA